MAINIQVIEDVIASVTTSIATNSQVIIEEENSPLPSGLTLGIKLGPLGKEGRVEVSGTAPDKVLTTRHPVQIEFQSYRDPTRTDISSVYNYLLSNPIYRDQLTANGIDPRYTSDLSPTPTLFEDKWEQGSSFTLYAYICDKNSVDLGLVETVELDGCYDTNADGQINKTTSTIITGEPD